MVKSHRGFPTHCPCGSRVSFRTSKTIANPGRLFHSCPYGNENNPQHLFKWTDESMVEEIEDIKDRFDEFEQEALGHAKDLEVLQTEVQNLIQKNMAHATTIQRCHHDVEETKDQLEGLKTDLKCLKNLLLCTLFLGFVYKFIL
ncbi:uncharacterized protein At1g43920, Chloroplastic-like [Raphanus sativus]|uniref:Uncharacterized protein At1g43920, Chloroplastic-like n=1 Tax=Raphanus sativus TaxID=3726 RepID=A0A6J0NUL9_RAPSA|nr:uncharacterized protein At1g43920, Chloroplastic-like [Raphanus sativus]